MTGIKMNETRVTCHRNIWNKKSKTQDNHFEENIQKALAGQVGKCAKKPLPTFNSYIIIKYYYDCYAKNINQFIYNNNNNYKNYDK